MTLPLLSRRSRIRQHAAAHATLAATLSLAVLFALHPWPTWLPACPIHAMTGLLCPGCGATRALAALLHADLPTALRLNPLAVAALPLLLLYGLAAYRRALRASPFAWPRLPPLAIHAALAATLLFTIARNLV